MPDMTITTMLPSERRAATSLAAIFALRLFGLITLLPVFALYLHRFQGATPLLIGIALGVYGLTQALLQLPLGMLSDRLGRKPIITVGLCILAAGSLLCATTTHVLGLILGRALQGACAIGSTLMATLADLTRSEQRSKAMAIIGGSLGIAFSTSMVAGSVFNAWFGVSGIFGLTAILAVLAIVLTHTWVPTPPETRFHRDVEPVPGLFKHIATHSALWRINLSVATEHALLIANFTALPIVLQHSANLPARHLWYLYLPTMVGAFACMLPVMILTEKHRCFKPMLIGSVVVLLLAELGLWAGHDSISVIAISLFAFFTAFSFLEAVLPSLTSRITPPASKGTAMGLYSTSQFLGMFLGGVGGGLVFTYYAAPAVFLFCAMIAALWLVPTLSIRVEPDMSMKFSSAL